MQKFNPPKPLTPQEKQIELTRLAVLDLEREFQLRLYQILAQLDTLSPREKRPVGKRMTKNQAKKFFSSL